MSGSTFQITTGSSYDFWVAGKKFTKSTTQSVSIVNNNTMHYVYYDTAGILQVTTAVWDLAADIAPVAMVYRYITGPAYAIFDERHGYDRDRAWHKWAHLTIGARYQSGLTGTFNNTSFSIAQGVIADEDIFLDTGGTLTQGRIWYRYTGAAAMAFESPTTTPYKLNGTSLRYDNAGTLTNANANWYVCYYIYDTNDKDYPIAVVVGQAQYSGLAATRNDPLPLYPGWPSKEFKLLYRVIYRSTGSPPTYIEAADYREVNTGPAAAAVSAVHNSLTGRDAADAHPASAITPDTTNFNNNLSPLDDTVQKALDTLDDIGLIVQREFAESISANDVITLTSTGKVKKAINTAEANCDSVLISLETGVVTNVKKCQCTGLSNINLLSGEGAGIIANMQIFVSSTAGKGTRIAPSTNIQKAIGYATGTVAVDVAEILICPGLTLIL
jgi:hypothetical protein